MLHGIEASLIHLSLRVHTCGPGHSSTCNSHATTASKGMIAAQQVSTHLLRGRGFCLSGCAWILQAW